MKTSDFYHSLIDRYSFSFKLYHLREKLKNVELNTIIRTQ